MQLTAITTLALALVTGTQAITFSFNTFGETSCQGFEENVFITQSGTNENNFNGGRKSFEVIKTSNQCSITLFTGSGFTGEFVTFGAGTLAVGDCFGYADGSAALSFDVVCS